MAEYIQRGERKGLHSNTIVLNGQQIAAIQAKLTRGRKKELCTRLGIYRCLLSKWLCYKSSINGWSMPRERYQQILKFINT